MSEEKSSPALDRQGVRDASWPERVEIFDTTLRDGVQFEGISVSSDDKLKVARQLDLLGVHFRDEELHAGTDIWRQGLRCTVRDRVFIYLEPSL